MGSKSYMDHVEPYKPLVNRDARLEEIDRAGEISFYVLSGCPEDGVEPDQRVIALAYELINPHNRMGALNERNAVNALLHTASFLVAEQETKRGKPFAAEKLGDMMLAVLPELAQSKHQLQQMQRENKPRTAAR